MNKFLILGLLPFICFSQTEDMESKEIRKNEFHSNILDLVAVGTLNIGYERLFKKNQSLSVDVNFFDTYSYYNAYDSNNNATSITLAYNLYFSNRKDHYGFSFFPLLRGRFGDQDVKENIYYPGTGNIEYTTISKDLSGFLVGFGLGYKWLFENKFSLGIGFDLSRDIAGNLDTDFYSHVEFRGAVKIGYRFQ